MHDRLPRRPAAIRSLVAVLAVAALLTACSAAGSPGSTAPASPSPSAQPGPVLTQEEAVARVLAENPQFAGIGPLDPDLIGQSAWYEVSPATVGWRITVTKGWGDCQAGCISRHTWTYDVDPSGAVTLVSEQGDPLEDGTGGGVPAASPPVAIPADGGPWIAGRALAGPVCPVVQNPPDPGCADRPVAGAVVVVRDGTGTEVARVTTAADGTFVVAVPGGGAYTVEGQPSDGIMGAPAALVVEVGDAPSAWVAAQLSYDTGIR
jgi:hypothetical protein